MVLGLRQNHLMDASVITNLLEISYSMYSFNARIVYVVIIALKIGPNYTCGEVWMVQEQKSH